MRSFLLNPLANLIALIVASVPELTILTFSIEGTISIIFDAIRDSISVGAPYVVPLFEYSIIESIVAFSACPKIRGPQDPTQSIYSLSSISYILLPLPLLKKIGVEFTLLKALTGEFTPPGIIFFALLYASILLLNILFI